MNEIDQYIAGCPAEHQPRLEQLRQLIRQTAPQATEKISWAMPTFYLKGNLVHFALNKNHIGLYPGESGIANFKHVFTEMGLHFSKGAVQFPHSNPLPEQLIKDIVTLRVAENTK